MKRPKQQLPELEIRCPFCPGHEADTEQTVAAIDRIPHRFLRTAVHPTAHVVPAATSFDDVYERAESFDAVYREIADRVANAAGEAGEVLYAVPGSPLVLERSVRHLIQREDVDVDLLPAISFLDGGVDAG